jgi:anti-sigma factor RsiW
MIDMTCTDCQNAYPDLLLDGGAPSAAVAAHVSSCPACQADFDELRATMALLDEWVAPEPSPFFDTRLHARLRAEQEEAHALPSAWQRFTGLFRPNMQRGLRPAMAGALGLAMLLGGGTAVTLLTHHGAAPAASSPTVNDLKIYDNNAQALQQMDMLDDSGGNAEPTS